MYFLVSCVLFKLMFDSNQISVFLHSISITVCHMTVNLGLVSTRHRRSQCQSVTSWLLCRCRALLFFSLSLCYAGNSGAHYSAFLYLNVNIFLLSKIYMWRRYKKIIWSQKENTDIALYGIEKTCYTIF